jgi:hypothetical protein
MQLRYRMLALSLLSGSCVLLVYAQDSPALGDVARQTRQQKQAKASQAQSKNGSAPKAARIITNEELPAHVVSTVAHPVTGNQPQPANYAPSSEEGKLPAETWRSQIQAQKSAVGSLQSQIDRVNESIHFAPGNCVANCVEWNERQREKQQQVEQMKSQLEDEKKKLEDMQESARQQGYGSAVYDP